MDTPSILLTRPLASSQLLATELNRKGYDCIIAPLLDILPTHAPLPDVSSIQAVMITSGNALDVLNKLPETLLNMPCFCVGPRTAERVRDFGFTQGACSLSDGIELARCISGALTDKTKAILHIAGRDVNSKAQDELQRLGFKVMPWTVYKAEAADTLTEESMTLFKEKKLDAVLVFSVRTAETLNRLLSQNQLETHCKAMLAIGLSKAITDVLNQMPWYRCVSPDVPTEDAVLACLEEIIPAS